MNRQLIVYALVLILLVPRFVIGQPSIPKSTTISANPDKKPPIPPAKLKIPTFQTRGRELLDPCGSPITLKGVNKLSVFEPIDTVGTMYFPEIAKTGANCVRIVWQMNNDATGQLNSLTRLDKLITNARVNKLIPIVGLWDFTQTDDGGFSHLNDYVAYWTKPDVLALIKKHQAHLIVNIANEAAKADGNGGNEDTSTDRDVYAKAYSLAVSTMRKAGINVPLMIDGMDRGKSLKCFALKGPELLSNDPLHNLIFSFHAYWPKSDTDADPTFIQARFAEVRKLPINVVIGELAGFGAGGGNDSLVCSPTGAVDYLQFADQANKAQMGWMLWEWGPKDNANCVSMDMTTNGTFKSLTTSPNKWVHDLAIDQPFSLKHAQKTPFVVNGFNTCPTP